MLDSNTLHEGDCLDLMAGIDDRSVDMILCDLPYGTTACHWDSIIPFEPLWAHYKRIIKPHGAIVLTASQPFTSALVMSNIKWFKYEWVWEKTNGGGFLNANREPLKRHENVVVFGDGSIKYHPVMRKGTPYRCTRASAGETTQDQTVAGWVTENKGERYPVSTLPFPNDTGLHPTQKPVPLFSYLIRTYTDAGDLVLDNCAGSGTTAIAALQTKRRYVLMEKDPTYCEVIRKRIAEWKADEQLDLIPDPRDVPKEEQASLI